MSWKVSSLSFNMSSTASNLDDPAIYSGKLNGLCPKVISYGVDPIATFQEVLWDHSTQRSSLPHVRGLQCTKVLLDNPIHHFRLTITLWMVCRAHS